MSDYLIREIETAPNVGIRYRTEAVAGGGDGHLEHLLLRRRDTGTEESVPSAALFILSARSHGTAEQVSRPDTDDAYTFILGQTGGLLDGLGDRVQDQVMDAPRATSAAGARRGTAVGYRLLDIHLHSFMM